MNGHGGGLLVVSPHPDDDILGAGGTMSKAVARGWEVTVLTVTTHGPPLYEPSNQALRLAETRDRRALAPIGRGLFEHLQTGTGKCVSARACCIKIDLVTDT